MHYLRATRGESILVSSGFSFDPLEKKFYFVHLVFDQHIFSSLSRDCYLIEGVPPTPAPVPKLTLVNRTHVENTVQRLTFSLDGK